MISVRRQDINYNSRWYLKGLETPRGLSDNKFRLKKWVKMGKKKKPLSLPEEKEVSCSCPSYTPDTQVLTEG